MQDLTLISLISQQIRFALHHHRLEPPLEDMPHPAMRAVVPLGVNPIELAHARTQIAFHRLHHNVKVVAHQAVGVAHPVKALTHLAQQSQPVKPILVIQKNRLAPVPARSHVVQPAGEFDA